ncbi:MAG: N-formylglutamate deformylase [Pseudomonadota bacterium]|nr:N-formylglutamate deformylase [Pseudomonadota bacterium]
MIETPPWLEVTEGNAPLLVSMPHTGTEIPDDVEAQLLSPWLSRCDADWAVDRLYDFADAFGVTIIRTRISRTVIDVNRDPSGRSLYPGQSTTGLCPDETFDGEPLYAKGDEPGEIEIGLRRERYFDPYHARLAHELGRLREKHPKIVLYDAHSIRSVIPRLFEGRLPQFNIGTNSGTSCDNALTQTVETICDASGHLRVTNGRFKGGWITRHYGAPGRGVNAIQMELACRGYLREPEDAPTEENWPAPYDPEFAAPLRAILQQVLQACIQFARTS